MGIDYRSTVYFNGLITGSMFLTMMGDFYKGDYFSAGAMGVCVFGNALALKMLLPDIDSLEQTVEKETKSESD
ncbi:MAG: hypothetical protein PHF86_03615 [Candidatus Nanoarchaeia archaeon]|nr:hypothetical protein [Candidatus Nanoarchaeia archaeon]